METEINKVLKTRNNINYYYILFEYFLDIKIMNSNRLKKSL